METSGFRGQLDDKKAETEKGCELLNQEKLTEEQLEKLSPEEKQNCYPRQTLTDDDREKRKAYRRQYRALATEEQREKHRASNRGAYAKLTEDQKEMKNAYRRQRRATATDEEREKTRTYVREKLAKLTDEQREEYRAYHRQYWATATDEQRERRSARKREWYAQLTDEQKEERKAYQQRRSAMATDEDREKARARIRGKHARLTDEQKEKLNAYQRRRRAMATAEDREKRRARDREMRAGWTDEQKEKSNAASRRYYYQKRARTEEWPEMQKVSLGQSLSTFSNQREMVNFEMERPEVRSADEREVNLVDCSREQQIMLGERRFDCSYVPSQKYVVKLEQGEIDEGGNFTTDYVKFTNVKVEQCETSATVKAEECTSQISGSNHFEVCEDGKIHVKTEYNV